LSLYIQTLIVYENLSLLDFTRSRNDYLVDSKVQQRETSETLITINRVAEETEINQVEW